MTIKELKAILNQHPDDAEVGFEHLRITYAYYEQKHNYLELGGNDISDIYGRSLQPNA